MSAPSQTLVIGTRGSKLALRQAELAAEELRRQLPDIEFPIQIIQTEGDRHADVPIASFGDKGVFVRALERSLLNREVDLAIHSLKDVPSDEDVPGTELVAFLPREDPRDALIAPSPVTLSDLPLGARVGTSSPRRRALLRSIRSDLELLDIRGNVDTRIRKLEAGQYDAIILAAAGLQRLGMDHLISEYLPVNVFVPDAGQGILAIQARAGDSLNPRIAAMTDKMSQGQAIAERAVVKALGADCHSPVGAHATVDGEEMTLLAVAATGTGSDLQRGEIQGRMDEAEPLGRQLGEQLRRSLDKAPRA